MCRFEEAAYTTVASIALQGVRNCKPQIGEYVAVVGLGLIGLITAQILRANGCRVIGIDLDPKKIELGLKMGMDAGAVKDPAQDVERFTSGRGVDHCIITASTKSNQPIELAGEITRKQGAVTVVGAVGMQIPRDVYYKKELEISVSMSYGPGRYDMAYEEGGVDYPYDFVRWTEQRNMEAVLDLMDRKLLDVKPLTTHLFSLEDALAAYDMIKAGKEPFVGILLSYEVEKQQKAAIEVPDRKALPLNGKLRMGFAGAGNYASLHLLPHLRKNPDVRLTTLVTATGMNAMQKAKKFKFASGTTEFEEVLKDPDTNAVGIATRHGSHAEFTVRALQAGKHVFVEKPLVVTSAQLDQVVNAYHTANEKGRCAVMVGTNRRFSPMAKELKAFFVNTSSKQMIYRVNSGHIPSSSWLHVPEEGGGMLVGEMCHFVDMMIFLTGEMPTTVYAQKMTVHNDTVADADNISIVIGFNKGSLGTLCYNTVGDKSISKERFEVYGDGRVGVLDDFRQLELHYKGDTTKKKSMNQDKGQIAQIEETVRGFRQGISPIPFEEIVMGMRVIFAAQTALQTGNAVSLGVQEIEEIRADAP